MSARQTWRETAGSAWRFIRGLPPNLVWWSPKATVRGLWCVVRACARGLRRAVWWSWATARYYAALFLYTSRRFFRLEGLLAAAVTAVYFASVFLTYIPKGGREILGHYYIVFTIGMILLAMNLLPRERDERTLEVLWSQPLHRGAIVLVQIVSLTVWCAVLMVLMSILFGRYLTGEGFALWVSMFGLTSAFSVALITVLISTFCRNAVATGIVAVLVFGVHYFWLKDLGPINIYFNPLPPPILLARASPDVPVISAVANRLFLLCFLGLAYDYLLLRLRHSSRWLT